MATNDSSAGPERRKTRPPAEIGPDRDDASLGTVREGALAPDREQTRAHEETKEPPSGRTDDGDEEDASGAR